MKKLITRLVMLFRRKKRNVSTPIVEDAQLLIYMNSSSSRSSATSPSRSTGSGSLISSNDGSYMPFYSPSIDYGSSYDSGSSSSDSGASGSDFGGGDFGGGGSGGDF